MLYGDGGASLACKDCSCWVGPVSLVVSSFGYYPEVFSLFCYSIMARALLLFSLLGFARYASVCRF
jgi:hypothetical protein